MTEQELVRRAKDGDQLAFKQLVTDNEKRIYNLCRRMVGDQEDAAELTQEAFLNAWRGLPGFQAESAFSTWLYRLASNVCLDFLRREKRRKSLSLTVVSLDQEEAVELEIPDQRYAPEGELERLEQRQAIRDGLARLSEEHRQVLVLRELSGLRYREIAQLLGVEEGTVKSRIARARGALRKVLVEEGNFFGKAPSKT